MGLIFKLKHQLNDIFSEVRKYIAPTYYHDRCERSLHMNLYAMHKREILLTLAGFIAGFILLFFIGLAGPNVNKLDTLKASEIFEKDQITNVTAQQSLLVSGPFSIKIPEMSIYSAHICLWVNFFIKGEEGSGAFQKRFPIAITIVGKRGNQSYQILKEDFINGSRFHHLNCDENQCDPIETLHLEYLEYPNYEITTRFGDLKHFNEKNPISDIHFIFQSANPSFTTLTIWFRFVFLTIAFIITFLFTHSLHHYPYAEWSMEQKWISALLVLLILFNNPLYPMIYLNGSKIPHLLEIFFQTTFFACLLLFWLCFYHGIRQNNRNIIKFYGTKIFIIGILWFTVFYGMSWSRIEKLEKPTLDEEATFNASPFLRLCSSIFYLFLLIYFIYLSLLVLTAFSELRSMPYFDLRLKLVTFMLVFTLTIWILIVISQYGSTNKVTHIDYLLILPWTYKLSSSPAFLSIFSITNLHICISAYFYYPSSASLLDSRVVRDNPTLSMINDSDEDIIYGSDVEQPLNQHKLIEVRDDEEESD